MRTFLKIILFPVALALMLVGTVCRFFCLFSGVVMNILAGLFFLFALLIFILLHDVSGGLAALAVAFALYLLPKIGNWLVDRLDDLHLAIKSI